MFILLPKAASLNINKQVCLTEKLCCSLSNLTSQYFPNGIFNAFLLVSVDLFSDVEL